ncbi:MAG: hypothetical protein MZV70_63670 [Desulfobacterales bacterium]|nr:hypothetical protein [Desulfobacterales bacterium]
MGRDPIAEPYVLVVDQTRGDASIRHGQADEASFARMLEAALAEHPDKQIVLKLHPDVVAGRKRGHFAALRNKLPARVTLLAEDAHSPVSSSAAAAVYVVQDSRLGFEALLWGKPVRSFGMPFYAGWGLTADELAAPARARRGDARGAGACRAGGLPALSRPGNRRALRGGAGDGASGAAAAPARALSAAGAYALGYSYWKKPIVRRYFQGSRSALRALGACRAEERHARGVGAAGSTHSIACTWKTAFCARPVSVSTWCSRCRG